MMANPDHSGTDAETPPEDRGKDDRSDIEQAVQARSDAVERGGEGHGGGLEPETFTDSGLPDGVGGTGGVTRNQDDDAQ